LVVLEEVVFPLVDELEEVVPFPPLVVSLVEVRLFSVVDELLVTVVLVVVVVALES